MKEIVPANEDDLAYFYELLMKKVILMNIDFLFHSDGLDIFKKN